MSHESHYSPLPELEALPVYCQVCTEQFHEDYEGEIIVLVMNSGALRHFVCSNGHGMLIGYATTVAMVTEAIVTEVLE